MEKLPSFERIHENIKDGDIRYLSLEEILHRVNQKDDWSHRERTQERHKQGDIIEVSGNHEW